MGDAAHGLGFRQAAAELALLCNLLKSGVVVGLRGQSLVQCGLVTEQTGMSPHGRLELGDQFFDLGFFARH